MSNISGIINQQYNFARLNKYDSILKRLRCVEGDEHRLLFEDGIEPYFDSPIFACKFAHKKNHDQFLALANEDGKLSVVDVSKSGERFGIWAHNNAIFDIAWPCNQMKITTASGDHTVKLFDVSNCAIREERTFYGHFRSVKTVTFRKDDPNVFATGGRDGNILVWDIRIKSCNTGKADQFIKSAHAVKVPITKTVKKAYRMSYSGVSIKSVTSLVFSDDNSLISCAAGDGLLKMWDLRKTYFIYKNKPEAKCVISYPGGKAKNGFSSLVIDKNCSKLYVNCLDNTIYCYNAYTFSEVPVMKYKGYQNNTFYVKSCLSPDGNYLISGSSDECAYVWKTNCSQPFMKLTGHQAEVTCVAWRQNPLPIIVTCSDDMKHKVWRVGSEDVPENWKLIGRGQAEMIQSETSPLKPKPKLKRLISELHCTPRAFKKFRAQCDVCFNIKNGSPCENCNVSHPVEKTEITLPSDVKQAKSGAIQPRKLFGNIQNKQMDEEKPILNSEKDSSVSFRHKEVDRNSEEEQDSCKSLLNSPTVNLPNFIVDGVAPHVSQSPLKKRSVDWLTRLRETQKFRKDIFQSYDQLSPSSSKSPKSEASPRSGLGKRKSISGSPQSSLLRFFKVTNSKCDHSSCSNKPNSCRLISSPHNLG